MPRNADGPGANRAAAETSLAGDGPQASRDARTGPAAEVITAPAVVAAVERASNLDRGWFKWHPERAHRVRRLMPGERDLSGLFPAGWPIYVVVQQVVPGVRFKAAFCGSPTPCGCEACVANFWAQFAFKEHQALAMEAASIMLDRRP